MGLWKSLGFDAWLGETRELDELYMEKREIEYAIKSKDHGWESTKTRFDYVMSQIKKLEAKGVVSNCK